MAQHLLIRPDPVESLAGMAQRALTVAQSMQTRRTGTAYYARGDGTGIILGDGSHDGINRYEPDTGVQLPLLDVSGIAAQAEQAQDAADKLTQQISSVKTTVDDMGKTLSGVTTKNEVTVSALSQVRQTLTTLSNQVSSLYDAGGVTDAQKTLVQQTVDRVIQSAIGAYSAPDGSKLVTEAQMTTAQKSVMSQVAEKYATQSGVTQQLSTAVTQTKEAITTTISQQIDGVGKTATQARGMAQTLASMIRQDAHGVTVGRADASGAYIMPTVTLDADGFLGIDTGHGSFRFATVSDAGNDGSTRIEGDITVGLHSTDRNAISMWEQVDATDTVSTGMGITLDDTEYISITSKPGYSQLAVYADSIDLTTSKGLSFSGLHANGLRLDPKYFGDITRICSLYPNITLTKSACYGLRCGPMTLIRISCTIHHGHSTVQGAAEVVRMIAPFQPKSPVNVFGTFSYTEKGKHYHVPKSCSMSPRKPGPGLHPSTVMMDAPEKLPADLDVTFTYISDDPTY